MAAKPKARGSKPKTKAQSEKQKEQSERFIKTARDLGVDESGENFEATVRTIIKPRPSRKVE